MGLTAPQSCLYLALGAAGEMKWELCTEGLITIIEIKLREKQMCWVVVDAIWIVMLANKVDR